jgi:hypothetical protein
MSRVLVVSFHPDTFHCLHAILHVRYIRRKAGKACTCSFQCHVEIVDAEKQEEPVARWRLTRAHQGWMLVRGPLVEAEQDCSVRIQDLTKVLMVRRRLGPAKERLVHLKLPGTSLTPMIVHVRFIAFLLSA